MIKPGFILTCITMFDFPKSRSITQSYMYDVRPILLHGTKDDAKQLATTQNCSCLLRLDRIPRLIRSFLGNTYCQS